MLSREYITNLLMTNDKAVARALVVLNQRQTQDERQLENTCHRNGQGFTPADARMGTSMARFYEQRGFLTPKQVAYWRKPNARGIPRICKYYQQLLSAADAKKQQVTSPDLNKMYEDLALLEEQYNDYLDNDYLDSDDFPTLENMQEQMAFLRKEIARTNMEQRKG